MDKYVKYVVIVGFVGRACRHSDNRQFVIEAKSGEEAWKRARDLVGDPESLRGIFGSRGTREEFNGGALSFDVVALSQLAATPPLSSGTPFRSNTPDATGEPEEPEWAEPEAALVAQEIVDAHDALELAMRNYGHAVDHIRRRCGSGCNPAPDIEDSRRQLEYATLRYQEAWLNLGTYALPGDYSWRLRRRFDGAEWRERTSRGLPGNTRSAVISR